MLSSIILITGLVLLIYLVRSFLKEFEGKTTALWEKSREDMMNLQKELNTQVGELAQNFTKHSIQLHAQHLAHLKELELKMLSGGVKEYAGTQTLPDGEPNFRGSEAVDEDWVEFTPQPFMPPSRSKGLSFGVEDADGKVEILSKAKDK